MKNSSQLFIVLTLIFGLAGCRPCRDGSDEEIAQCLAKSPKEDVRKNPQVAQFLSKHKVYVSMTSSPKRIEKIVLVLQTLNLDLIEKIYISLPEKFRDKEEYVIPDGLRNFPKVEILQGGSDLGPIMKLLPAVKKVQEMGDPKAIVLTVDDDTGYFADVTGQLIKNSVIYDAVVGSKGINIDMWKINGRLWPQLRTLEPGCYSGYDMSYCDVLEGYGGVAYPVRLVNTETLTTLSKLSKACKMSDDIVIGFGLALEGAPRGLDTTIPFFGGVTQFEYGFQEDALHRGSGFLETASSSSSSTERYQECVKTMNDWLVLQK